MLMAAKGFDFEGEEHEETDPGDGDHRDGGVERRVRWDTGR